MASRERYTGSIRQSHVVVLEQIRVTVAYEIIGEENTFPSNSVIGASLEEVWQAAEKWIAEQIKLEPGSDEASQASAL